MLKEKKVEKRMDSIQYRMEKLMKLMKVNISSKRQKKGSRKEVL